MRDVPWSFGFASDGPMDLEDEPLGPGMVTLPLLIPSVVACTKEKKDVRVIECMMLAGTTCTQKETRKDFEAYKPLELDPVLLGKHPSSFASGYVPFLYGL